MTEIADLIQDLEQTYLNTKAKISLLEEKTKKEKETLSLIESRLKQYFKDTGQKSLKTELGIGVSNTLQRYYNHDSDIEDHAIWAVENDELSTLSMRLKVSGIDEYKEMNDGELPPGVTEGEKYNVRVSIPRHLLNEAKQNIFKK